MERYVTERQIYRKKAASKLDLGTVNTGGKKLVYTRLCMSGLIYLRHSITYTYAASTGPFSSPQVCVNDIYLCIHLAFVVTTSTTFYLK